MTFVVDTGTTTTTICGPDANSLNLNLSSFSDRISQTSIDHQGNISPLIAFHDCTLDYSNGDVQYSVTLDIDVEVQLKNPKNTHTFMNSLSLLGMDFLESFKICFRNDCVYLEKEND